MGPQSNHQSDNIPKKENHPAIVLIGNMQVGKSALFSHMVENKTRRIHAGENSNPLIEGKIKGAGKFLLDTPGVYSIFTYNEDDRLARDILLPHMTTDLDIQGIVLVLDAKNLKRSISIALQYLEYGLPVLLDINMIDEAAPRGIDIHIDKLSKILGLDVCTTIAREGIGVRKLASLLKNMKRPKSLVQFPPWVEQFIESISAYLQPETVSPRAAGLLFLTGDQGIRTYIHNRFGPGVLKKIDDLALQYRKENVETSRLVFTSLFHRKAEQIAQQVQTIKTSSSRSPFLVKLGDWCTQFTTGIPIAFVCLMLMYLFVGSFGAAFLADLINVKLFEGYLVPWTTALLAPVPPFIRDMIVDPDFGLLPTGVFLALGLVLPVLFCFYIAFGILEDSGYLPRLSVLLDRLFQKMGLNGKGVIPLVMGFSCVTMALLTTRMLDNKKQKIIANVILLLGMPCAPLLAVMFIILGKLPVSATFAVFGIIFLQIFIAGFIANKLLPGGQTTLLMEIPSMRVPHLPTILKMAAKKTFFFMKEAVPVFIFASILVFLFDRVGGLTALEKILKPVINGFMGLPEKSVQVFIKTIIRRENGATEIEHLSSVYNNLQLVVNLLVMTFLSPCLNAIMVLIKERGTKVGMTIIGIVMIYAVLMGSAVYHTCQYFGITFT